MDWYVGVLKKYAVFSGRARRRVYWMFVLINAVIAAILAILDSVMGFDTTKHAGPLGSIYSLAVLIPSLAVSVRRLHDTNHSGGWIFVNLILIVGQIIFLVFLVTEGTRGDNRYGPDPKLAEATGAVAPSVPAGWYTDPSGRHELRYWDGRVWTSNVSDGGVASVDPIQP